jgi:hypothetical protein
MVSFYLDMILIALGGKVAAICDIRIRTTRAQSEGVASRAAGLQSVNGFDQMQNKCSTVETSIAETQRRCHRCGTNATARALLRAKPLSNTPVCTTNPVK